MRNYRAPACAAKRSHWTACNFRRRSADGTGPRAYRFEPHTPLPLRNPRPTRRSRPVRVRNKVRATSVLPSSYRRTGGRASLCVRACVPRPPESVCALPRAENIKVRPFRPHISSLSVRTGDHVMTSSDGGQQGLPVIMATGCRMPRSPSRDKDFATCVRTGGGGGGGGGGQQQPFGAAAVVLSRVSGSYPETFIKR